MHPPCDAAISGFDRRHLHLAVATLLHESTRVDLESHLAEYAAAEYALADLFGLDSAACAARLQEARHKGGLTSYYAQVAVINVIFRWSNWWR